MKKLTENEQYFFEELKRSYINLIEIGQKFEKSDIENTLGYVINNIDKIPKWIKSLQGFSPHIKYWLENAFKYMIEERIHWRHQYLRTIDSLQRFTLNKASLAKVEDNKYKYIKGKHILVASRSEKIALEKQLPGPAIGPYLEGLGYGYSEDITISVGSGQGWKTLGPKEAAPYRRSYLHDLFGDDYGIHNQLYSKKFNNL